MIYLAKYNRGRKSKALQEATDLTQGGAFADIVATPRPLRGAATMAPQFSEF